MKILVVHNHYQQAGGESHVFEAECALLEAHGHEVLRYEADNAAVPGLNALRLGARTVWSGETYARVRRLIRSTRPAVVHVHNTLPLVSPSVYYAAFRERVPVVQTLHNYRLLCLPGDLYRDGGVCEDCVGKPVPWPGVVHACYRGSVSASAVVAAMLITHRALRTYGRRIDRYIALTDFARRTFIRGGIPAEKLVVKPNFVAPDPGVGLGDGAHALFVGRLVANKGVGTLLAAWERLGGTVPLVIAGDGPLAGAVRAAAAGDPSIRYVGWQERPAVRSLMKAARLLVFPSEWYEGFGLVVVEAFAAGLPVVASDLGGNPGIVEAGRTGSLFTPGDPEDLAAKVRELLSRPDALTRMRAAARQEYLNKYTAEANHRLLCRIYEGVLGHPGAAPVHQPEAVA